MHRNAPSPEVSRPRIVTPGNARRREMTTRIQRLGSTRRAVFAGVVLTAAVVLGVGYAYGAITATNSQYTSS